MSISQETVDKIQNFATQRQKAEDEHESQQLSPASLQSYSRKLDETLKELQDQVKHQEGELQKLRISNSIDLTEIGTDNWTRVSQVRRAKKAYDSLLQSNSDIPDPGSALPSLLAVEETSRLVRESKVSARTTVEKLSADRQRSKAEEANLHEARLIQSRLEERIDKARREKSRGKTKSPEQLAQELIDKRREQNEELVRATGDLGRSLHGFIDETLAPMLAAEDLGGPTVGDALNISDAVLEVGYTSLGKPKKPKRINAEDNDESQQHIDELFHRQRPENSDGGQRGSANRKEAAASEMHALLDALLEAGASYIDVPRESAASRFLVRAKVAQFHPRDAKRFRLIDFGRSLDD
ncbi:hypothetical protein PHISP_03982 [Aspergillus sp. HF37]|nr:hypothetical protein PHISP_03982 [Aspergillus sp. HF37]